MGLRFEDETYAIRGAIYEVYKTLGNGFLEEVYQKALEEELRLRDIPFKSQASLRIMYKGCECGFYKPDLICFDRIIVEIKAVEHLIPKHQSQTLNYLNATNLDLCLLVNFGSFPHVEVERFVH